MCQNLPKGSMMMHVSVPSQGQQQLDASSGDPLPPLPEYQLHFYCAELQPSPVLAYPALHEDSDVQQCKDDFMRL
jgi:hypothetical protein